MKGVGPRAAQNILSGIQARDLAQAIAQGEIRFDGPIYATPVAANGTLYIASQRKLYAFREAQPNR